MGRKGEINLSNDSYGDSEDGKLKALQQAIVRQFAVNKPLPIWLILFLFASLGFLFWMAFLSLASFPSPIKRSELELQPLKFNAENAYDVIRHLAVDIGYRVTGTEENDVLTVQYLKHEIEEIIKHKNPDLDIEMRHVIATGVFPRKARFYSTINNYIGIQNIVVKLQPKNVNPNLKYILLNSHFDTVPMSPGAGDDATMVGVMMELLRVFSKQEILSHPIVFLFNGCEENALAGSHAFITQDPWMANVGILLNLEVTGPGGKELMFQTNQKHPWLMGAYSDSVPNPYAASTGEELYTSGLIQSDTDFTNFKNLAKTLPAMDFAHARNCYVYHTAYDDIEAISMGSLQHTGDNMIALIKELDTRKELEDFDSVADLDATSNVFFDYLGIILFFYSKPVGSAVNTILFAIVTIITAFCAYQIKSKQGIRFMQILMEYTIALGIQLLSIVLGFCVLALIAFTFDFGGRPMSYYYHQWLIWGLYFCPYNFCSMLLPYIYIRYREKQSKVEISTSYYTQLALHAHCNIISIILIVLTAAGIRSAYMVLISTLFYFGTTMLNVIFGFVRKGNKWLYLHCLGQLLPSLYYFYAYIQTLETMIPIRARAYNGSKSNPDLLIAIITAIYAILSTGFFAPIFMMFRQRKVILSWFLVVFGIFAILAMTPVGFPFKERHAVQRFTILHTKREFYSYDGTLKKNDSGYYVYGYDRLGAATVENTIPQFENGIKGEENCEDFVLCGQPWYRIQNTGNIGYNYWIPAGEPLLDSPFKPSFKFLGTQEPANGLREFEFSTTGPAAMHVIISPLPGVKLVKWSFVDEIFESDTWKDRPVYFIQFIQGIKEVQYQPNRFNLTFDVPDNWMEPYIFDISFGYHYVHVEETKTKEFVDFTNAFPKWANVQNWTAYHIAAQF